MPKPKPCQKDRLDQQLKKISDGEYQGETRVNEDTFSIFRALEADGLITFSCEETLDSGGDDVSDVFITSRGFDFLNHNQAPQSSRFSIDWKWWVVAFLALAGVAVALLAWMFPVSTV